MTRLHHRHGSRRPRDRDPPGGRQALNTQTIRRGRNEKPAMTGREQGNTMTENNTSIPEASGRMGMRMTGLSRIMRTGVAMPAALALALGQAGVANASIDNTATASGTPAGSAPGTPPLTDTDTETVDVAPRIASLNVTKTPSINGGPVPSTGANVGDVIDYTYTVENAGNVTLYNVTLADIHDGDGPAPVPTGAVLTDNPQSDPSGTPIAGSEANSTLDGDVGTVLSPGDVITYTASYTVTQADVDARGSATTDTQTDPQDTANDNDIDNIAVASAVYDPTPNSGAATGGTGGGTDASGDEVTVTGSDFADVLLFVDQGITIEKTVSPDGTPVAAGQVLTYTYRVTNTGNINLENVGVAETSFNGLGTPPTPSLVNVVDAAGTEVADAPTADVDSDGDVDSLAPDNVAVFTATYTVVQEDIDQLQ